jgi:hypothetical protein
MPAIKLAMNGADCTSEEDVQPAQNRNCGNDHGTKARGQVVLQLELELVELAPDLAGLALKLQPQLLDLAVEIGPQLLDLGANLLRGS